MSKLKKPRGRCTPYAFFLNVCREQCAKKLSKVVDFKELQNICWGKWNSMTDFQKIRFVQMSKYDEARYEKELEQYNQYLKDRKKGKLKNQYLRRKQVIRVPFSADEDKLLMEHLTTSKGETSHRGTTLTKEKIKQLAQDLGRVEESICGRLKKLRRGSSSRRIRHFSLEEDKIIIDNAVKDLLKTKSLQKTRVQNYAELATALTREGQSIRNRWNVNIRTWLLQYYAKTLNLEIRPMLANMVANNYESERSIDWDYVLTFPEFNGHTGDSLRHLFHTILINASERLKVPPHDLSLKQVAKFSDVYKPRKLPQRVQMRQEQLIEYFENLVKLNNIDNFV